MSTNESLFSIFKNSHINIKISAFSALISAISITLFLDTLMIIFIFNNIASIDGEDKKNEMLGAIETAYGLSELIFAIPIGYLADKYSRTLVLRSGAIMEYITLLCTLYIIYNIANEKWNNNISYVAMIIINILFGISWGLSSGPIGALVADSVSDGKRSKIYMISSTFGLIGSLIGPILIIVLSRLFSNNTDEWNSKKLANFIYIGLILHIIPVSCMFLYRDIPKNDSELDEGLLSYPNANFDNYSPRTPFNTPYEISPEISFNDQIVIQDIIKNKPFFTFVPTILFFAELVVVMGSGMTVKFWPLFLKNECNMSMETIQILYIIVILEIIVFQYLAQKLSKKFGRIYTIFTLNIMGIIAQTALGIITNYSNIWLIGFLYTFRFSIMNSSGPLINSALMDIVPQDHRAKWESLYSIVTLGWCGSAMFGGYINDKMDYSGTFLITSVIHLIGNLMYLLIRNKIPDE